MTPLMTPLTTPKMHIQNIKEFTTPLKTLDISKAPRFLTPRNGAKPNKIIKKGALPKKLQPTPTPTPTPAPTPIIGINNPFNEEEKTKKDLESKKSLETPKINVKDDNFIKLENQQDKILFKAIDLGAFTPKIIANKDSKDSKDTFIERKRKEMFTKKLNEISSSSIFDLFEKHRKVLNDSINILLLDRQNSITESMLSYRAIDRFSDSSKKLIIKNVFDDQVSGKVYRPSNPIIFSIPENYQFNYLSSNIDTKTILNRSYKRVEYEFYESLEKKNLQDSQLTAAEYCSTRSYKKFILMVYEYFLNIHYNINVYMINEIYEFHKYVMTHMKSMIGDYLINTIGFRNRLTQLITKFVVCNNECHGYSIYHQSDKKIEKSEKSEKSEEDEEDEEDEKSEKSEEDERENSDKLFKCVMNHTDNTRHAKIWENYTNPVWKDFIVAYNNKKIHNCKILMLNIIHNDYNKIWEWLLSLGINKHQVESIKYSCDYLVGRRKYVSVQKLVFLCIIIDSNSKKIKCQDKSHKVILNKSILQANFFYKKLINKSRE